MHKIRQNTDYSDIYTHPMNKSLQKSELKFIRHRLQENHILMTRGSGHYSDLPNNFRNWGISEDLFIIPAITDRGINPLRKSIAT